QTSGFLAQEVEQAAKEAGYNFDGVTKPRTKTDLYSLSYESFVVPLVKAVQEQQAMIIKQQEQIVTLEKKVAALLGSKTGEIKPRFHLTPNPSGDYSMLICDDKNITINSLILYNSAGMMVWSQKTPIIADNPVRIAVQQLSSGLYYLNIQTANGWQSIKLAK
ncbi:MAG: T9SS type A sorting domain-containing protein, partial [Chitinophagaceae bacterium]